MHHDFIGKYSRLDSPVHRVPAAWKLALALASVIGLVAAPLDLWWFFAADALLLAPIVAASRIPPWFILGRLLLWEPFVAGIAVLSLFQSGGGLMALSIVVRSTLCLAIMILLTNTTPFSDLLEVLRRIRVPNLLVTVLALMVRYLFVLVDESERLQRARASRTFAKRRSQAWWSSAAVIGALFVRSTERAERIYTAMCARGWK